MCSIYSSDKPSDSQICLLEQAFLDSIHYLKKHIATKAVPCACLMQGHFQSEHLLSAGTPRRQEKTILADCEQVIDQDFVNGQWFDEFVKFFFSLH